jgi:hypothetical protein
MNDQSKRYDVFISHASEDKESFVRPLAIALTNLGLRVWYDEFSLRLGDSLSRSIDKGLAESSYGLTVISPHFIKKRWPEYELRGLVAREISEDRVILPMWHGVTRDQVVKFSPPLADKIAIITEGQRPEDIAVQILREVRPDLYSKDSRSELMKHISDQARKDLEKELGKLQEELEEVRDELSEYRCQWCNAPLVTRDHIAVDKEGKHEDVYEIFECGCRTLGGYMEEPCPSDPRFPKFEDYNLHFFENPGESIYKWQCNAFGKTDMARRVSLWTGHGRTREEAERSVRNYYESRARKARK